MTAYYSKKDLIGRILARRRLIKVLPLIEGELLDIACGDNELVRAYGKGKGVDIIDYGHADIVVNNLAVIPVIDHSFDTATIIASLNYFDDPVAVLREIYRILTETGQLILTMPNLHIMKIWHRIREPWANKPGFSLQEIDSMAASAGFKLKRKKKFLGGLNNILIYKKQQFDISHASVP